MRLSKRILAKLRKRETVTRIAGPPKLHNQFFEQRQIKLIDTHTFCLLLWKNCCAASGVS